PGLQLAAGALPVALLARLGGLGGGRGPGGGPAVVVIVVVQALGLGLQDPRRLAQRPRQRRELRRSEQQQDHGENDQNLGRAKSSHDNPLQQGAQVDRTPSPGGCDGRVVSIRESSSRSAERSLSSRRPVPPPPAAPPAPVHARAAGRPATP